MRQTRRESDGTVPGPHLLDHVVVDLAVQDSEIEQAQVLREVDERGPVAIAATAEILSLDFSRVTLAVDYYSDYQEEIDAEIAAADEASERAEHARRIQRQLIA